MDKVKIKDITTGVIKEIKKSLAGDFIGTGKFTLVEEKSKPKKEIEKTPEYKYEEK